MNGSFDVGSSTYHVTLMENFDFEAHQDFRNHVKSAITNKASSLILDFGRVEYIDSSALGMLMLAKTEIENVGGRVSLNNVHGYVEKVLSMVKFDQMFAVQNTGSKKN